MDPTTWNLEVLALSCVYTWKNAHSNMGWCKLGYRLWTLMIFNKLYNTWVLLMGPRKPQVHVKWMWEGSEASNDARTSPSIKFSLGQLMSQPWSADRRSKFTIESKVASCSMKFWNLGWNQAYKGNACPNMGDTLWLTSDEKCWRGILLQSI